MNNTTSKKSIDLSKYSRKELEEAFVQISIKQEQTELQLKWYEGMCQVFLDQPLTLTFSAFYFCTRSTGTAL